MELKGLHRTASDKVLGKYKYFHNARNPKYDGF